MKKFLLFLLVVVVLFLAYAWTRPDTYKVERSASIAAPADIVYTRIANFRAWENWSPWEKLDPAMKKEFSGTEGQVGSVYAWAGNKDVGEGRMTLKDATPNSHVGIQLDFIEPFASTATTDFALAPEGGGTKVTWTMNGNHNLISKAMCIFMDMDKMIGTDIEKGLGALKEQSQTAAAEAARAAEAAAAAAAAATTPAPAPAG